MMRSILIFLVTSAFLIKIDAQVMCNVGEPARAENNFCNDGDIIAGNGKCSAYCSRTFGKELIKAACSPDRPNTNKRECICSLKCANGGCWGDPHCHSFDNTQFGYQSLKKYFVFKPCKPFPTLPEFTIMQGNHFWGPGPMAVLDNVDLVIPEFGQSVNVLGPKARGQQIIVTLNKKQIAVPYRFSRFVSHREEFINFAFSDPARQNLVITTNFGLRLIISVHPSNHAPPYGMFSDISVDIPRHPELRGNTCGIFGRWDDNPANDNLDASGKPQPLDAGFSRAFGDSWLVDPNSMPTECEIELSRKAHEEHDLNFDKEHRERLTKLCKDNLDRPNMHDCMDHLDRPKILIENCVLDLSHMPDEAGQQSFLKAMVAKIDHSCPHIDIPFKEAGSKESKEL